MKKSQTPPQHYDWLQEIVWSTNWAATRADTPLSKEKKTYMCVYAARKDGRNPDRQTSSEYFYYTKCWIWSLFWKCFNWTSFLVVKVRTHLSHIWKCWWVRLQVNKPWKRSALIMWNHHYCSTLTKLLNKIVLVICRRCRIKPDLA